MSSGPESPPDNQPEGEGESARVFFASVFPMVEANMIKHRNSLKSSEVDPENIDQNFNQALAIERGFAEQVIAVYERWASEKDTVVLWDIDETMVFNRDLDNDPTKTTSCPRPVLLPFLDHLAQTYPKISMGILSTRGFEAIKDQLEGKRERNNIPFLKPYIDSKNIHSTSKFHINPDMLDTLPDQISSLVIDDESIHLEKYFYFGDLLEQNVKLIDDNAVAKLLGNSALCTESWRPDPAYCVKFAES